MVQDRAVCRALLALVERLDDPFFVTGSWFGGSTMRIRAILTAALGEEDASEQLFGLAVAAFEEAQSPPWLAHTSGLGGTLPRTRNRDRAREHATAAVEAIGELELTVTRSRAEAILAG